MLFDNWFYINIVLFSKVFGWLVFIFGCFTAFVFFFLITDWLVLRGSGIFSTNLFASKIFFIQAFYWIITIFLRKTNSFTIVFKEKVSDFIDRHLFIALIEHTLENMRKHKK